MENSTACADFPTDVELADDATALGYLFTNGCGGVAHYHACHAYIRLLICFA